MKLVSSKSTRGRQPRKQTDGPAASRSKAPKKKGGVKGFFAVLLAVVLFAAACGAGYVIYSAANCDTILPNVYAYGMSLGGLTEEEAAMKLASAVDEPDESLTLRFSTGETLSISAGSLVERFNSAGVARAAWEYGRTEEGKVSPLSYLNSLRKPVELFSGDVTLQLDESKLRAQIAAIASEVNSSLVESAYTVSGNTLTIVKGASGVLVDEDAVYDLVLDALEQGNYGVIDYTPDFSSPTSLSLEDIQHIVSKEPVNAHFDENFNIIPGQDGITFDLENASRLYDAADNGAVITIALQEIPAEVDEEALNALLYRDKLGSCVSTLTSNYTRSKNIELAAGIVNGYQMLPGDIFSFNDVVGQRTEERGFGGAPAYMNGEVVTEVGGGICQVSSSIYYCCLYADLEIVSRTGHIYAASYVPLGMDATVSWGGPDFRFKNSSEYPVKIVAWRENDRLYVELWGTKTNTNRVEMTYSVLETYQPTTIYREDESVAPGSSVVKTSATTGYKVETYKAIYDENDNLISKNRETVTNYSKRDTVVLVAPGELYLYDPSVPPPESEEEDPEGGEFGGETGTETDPPAETEPAPEGGTEPGPEEGGETEPAPETGGEAESGAETGAGEEPAPETGDEPVPEPEPDPTPYEGDDPFLGG